MGEVQAFAVGAEFGECFDACADGKHFRAFIGFKGFAPRAPSCAAVCVFCGLFEGVCKGFFLLFHRCFKALECFLKGAGAAVNRPREWLGFFKLEAV